MSFVSYQKAKLVQKMAIEGDHKFASQISLTFDVEVLMVSNICLAVSKVLLMQNEVLVLPQLRWSYILDSYIE